MLCLRFRTQDRMMVGTDRSTEVWQLLLFSKKIRNLFGVDGGCSRTRGCGCGVFKTHQHEEELPFQTKYKKSVHKIFLSWKYLKQFQAVSLSHFCVSSGFLASKWKVAWRRFCWSCQWSMKAIRYSNTFESFYQQICLGIFEQCLRTLSRFCVLLAILLWNCFCLGWLSRHSALEGRRWWKNKIVHDLLISFYNIEHQANTYCCCFGYHFSPQLCQSKFESLWSRMSFL